MALTWPATKDPDEIKDYVVRFGALLDGDTLVTKAVSVVSGDVVVESSSISTDATYGVSSNVTIWFSGGTLGETCEILTRVTTAGGRTFDQTAKLKIRSK